MTKVIAVSPEELFAIKVKAGKDAEAARAAESIFEAYHHGWVRAAGQGGINLGHSQEDRGDIALELKGQIVRYGTLPATSSVIFIEIVRAWIVTQDEAKEEAYSNEFVFARFSQLHDILRKELQNTGGKTVKKVYRILARLHKDQVNHNMPTLAVLLEVLAMAPPEHLIAMGKILATGAVDPYFVDFRLPKLVSVLERMSAK